MLMVKIIFFSILREKLNLRETFIECEKNTTLIEAIEILQKKIDIDNYDIKSCMFAVNQNYVENNYILIDGDEIAIIPPVSGGSDVIEW